MEKVCTNWNLQDWKIHRQSVKCVKKIQARIENIFWDDAIQRWRIIGNSDLYDQTEFYPDGVAQIYPLIYEFPVKEKKKQKRYYMISLRKSFNGRN